MVEPIDELVDGQFLVDGVVIVALAIGREERSGTDRRDARAPEVQPIGRSPISIDMEGSPFRSLPTAAPSHDRRESATCLPFTDCDI